MIRVGVVGIEELPNKSENLFKSVLLLPSSPQNMAISLDTCDALIINNVNHNYIDLITQAIKLSKHIFLFDFIHCETKTLATLIKLASEANVHIHILHAINNDYVCKKLHELVPQKTIIQYVHLSALTTPPPMLLRNIDLLIKMAASQIKNVHTSSICDTNGQIHTIDTRIEFFNGTSANCFWSNVTGKEKCFLNTYHTEGFISYNVIKSKVSSFSLTHNPYEKKTQEIKNKTISEHFDLFSEHVSSGHFSQNALDYNLSAIQLKKQILTFVP